MDSSLDPLVESFARSKRALNRSPGTIASYLADLRYLNDWAVGRGQTLEELKRGDIETYLAWTLDSGLSPATTARRFRSFLSFYNWAAEQDEIVPNPMVKMKAPSVVEAPPPVVTPEQFAALLKACETPRRAGSGPAPDRLQFENKRDRAMLLMLYYTGMRASELVGIRLDTLDMSVHNEAVTVRGKGAKVRAVALVPIVAEAVDKYLRHRRKHPNALSPYLWLGAKGPVTDSGLRQMLERRCEDAGIPRINPHRFRHTFAHLAKVKKMSDGDLMAVAGWSTPQMLHRYGKSAAQERAQEAHRRLFEGG